MYFFDWRRVPWFGNGLPFGSPPAVRIPRRKHNSSAYRKEQRWRHAVTGMTGSSPEKTGVHDELAPKVAWNLPCSTPEFKENLTRGNFLPRGIKFGFEIAEPQFCGDFFLFRSAATHHCGELPLPRGVTVEQNSLRFSLFSGFSLSWAMFFNLPRGKP